MLFDQNFDHIQGPKRKEYAEIIHGAAANLLSMVNDILEISRIEAGEYPTNFREVSLVEFLEATLQLLNVEYAERRIDLDVSRFPEGADFYLRPPRAGTDRHQFCNERDQVFVSSQRCEGVGRS